MDIAVSVNIAACEADEATWTVPRLMGCDYAQGHYLSEPLPAEQFEQWSKACEVPRLISSLA